jgi:hypothetical protein
MADSAIVNSVEDGATRGAVMICVVKRMPGAVSKGSVKKVLPNRRSRLPRFSPHITRVGTPGEEAPQYLACNSSASHPCRSPQQHHHQEHLVFTRTTASSYQLREAVYPLHPQVHKGRGACHTAQPHPTDRRACDCSPSRSTATAPPGHAAVHLPSLTP